MPVDEHSTCISASAKAAWFTTTHWGVVLTARGSDPVAAEAALNTLCHAYWRPLYVFARRLGHSAEDAEDLTQGFFARLLEKEYLKSTQPEKGKFRTFLLTAFKRFMATEWQRAGRLKRGGGQQVISMDAVDTENRYLAEPVDQMSPEKHFDKQWAIALLDRVMLNLQREAESAGKAELFAELKPSLTGEQDRASYLQVGERLAVSEGALRVAAHRLRQRYRDLLRQEIAQTLESAGDVDEEIRDLFASVT